MQVTSTNVQLLKESGKMATVALRLLSDYDLRFVRNHLRTIAWQSLVMVGS